MIEDRQGEDRGHAHLPNLRGAVKAWLDGSIAFP